MKADEMSQALLRYEKQHNGVIVLKADEMLRELWRYDRMIRCKSNEIAALRDLETSVTSALKQDVVQTSGAGDKIGELTAKILDLQSELHAEIAEYIKRRNEVVKLLGKLPSVDECEVLYDRYAAHMSWNNISKSTGFTRQWICELHRRGIENINRILDNSLHQNPV